MSSAETDLIFRQKLELLILCHGSKVLQRAQEAANRYSFSCHQLNEDELVGYFSDSKTVKPQVTLINQNVEESPLDFGRRAVELLAKFPKSCVVAVLQNDSLNGDLSGLQNLHIVPLSEEEFFNTPKFEYACLYRTRAQYLEIQKNEVFPGTTIPFSAYIKLPLNQKYLAVIFADTVLTDERFHKITSESDHLLIDLGESEQYANYIGSFFDRAGIGLRKRTRALFLSFCHHVLLWNESLLFNHKTLPPRITDDLFIKIKDLLFELVDLMKHEGDLWDVLRDACKNDFFAQWRAPWIAVYASLISARSGAGEPICVGIAALLTDLGLYELPRESFHEFLSHGPEGAKVTVLDEYLSHPLRSIDRLLERGVPLEEDIKKAVLAVHEHADGSGFPNKLVAADIPIEAAIIRFAELIDFQVRSQAASKEVDFKLLKEQLLSAEAQRRATYPLNFFESISKALL